MIQHSSLLNDLEPDHGCALNNFVKWCDDNFLDLNVSKTKKKIIDFRKSTVVHEASVIHNKEVEIVDNYKYLGTVFDPCLKFDANTDNCQTCTAQDPLNAQTELF